MKTFKEQCKSPNRLADGVRSSFTDMLEKEIDTQMDGWMKKHNDLIDQNGLKIVYNGKKKISEKVNILLVENNNCSDLVYLSGGICILSWSRLSLEIIAVPEWDRLGCAICLCWKCWELAKIHSRNRQMERGMRERPSPLPTALRWIQSRLAASVSATLESSFWRMWTDFSTWRLATEERSLATFIMLPLC